MVSGTQGLNAALRCQKSSMPQFALFSTPAQSYYKSAVQPPSHMLQDKYNQFCRGCSGRGDGVLNTASKMNGEKDDCTYA
jgi:hypothetical protein